MPTRKNPYSKPDKMPIGEATAIAQLSDCEQITKTLFIELINLHADQRRDWGDDMVFGTDMHFLLLRKLGIHEFTEKEMKEIHAIVSANSPGKTPEEIKYACRYIAYNHFLDHLVKRAARLDYNGKLIFRAVTSEYVSPYPKDEIAPEEEAQPQTN